MFCCHGSSELQVRIVLNFVCTEQFLVSLVLDNNSKLLNLHSVIHATKPLNDKCHMRLQWTFPVAGLHALYVLALIAFTRAVRHVEFRFDELRDLWKGILVSATSIIIWVTAFVLNEIHEEISWLQVASRFVLLVTV